MYVPFAFHSLTPALLREATYSTIRIGAYEPIKVLFGATDRHHTPLAKKLGAGATSGIPIRVYFIKISESLVYFGIRM